MSVCRRKHGDVMSSAGNIAALRRAAPRRVSLAPAAMQCAFAVFFFYVFFFSVDISRHTARFVRLERVYDNGTVTWVAAEETAQLLRERLSSLPRIRVRFGSRIYSAAIFFPFSLSLFSSIPLSTFSRPRLLRYSIHWMLKPRCRKRARLSERARTRARLKVRKPDRQTRRKNGTTFPWYEWVNPCALSRCCARFDRRWRRSDVIKWTKLTITW